MSTINKWKKAVRELTAEIKKDNDNHIPAHITMTVHALIEEQHENKDVDNITEYLFTHYDIMNLQFMDIILILKSLVPLLDFINTRISEFIDFQQSGCFTYNVANLVTSERYLPNNLQAPTDEQVTKHTLQLNEKQFKARKFFLKKANTELHEQYLYLRYVKDIDQWKTSYGNH